MIGDATQGVGEPGLRVDAVELRGLDQRKHRSSALTAAEAATSQALRPIAVPRNARSAALFRRGFGMV